MMISSCYGVLMMDRPTDNICECRVAFATEKCGFSRGGIVMVEGHYKDDGKVMMVMVVKMKVRDGWKLV